MPEQIDTGLACCVCGGTEARVWRVAPDRLLGGEELFQAVRCVRCGTARLDPRPADLSRFYAPTTYARAESDAVNGATDDETGARLDEYNRRLAQRADGVARAENNKPVRLLDAGCGDGRFLAAMADRGWRVEGLETDGVAAGLARRRTGAVVHETPMETLDLPAAAFDMVTLWHVLEHVPDPRATLEAVRRVLRPGGTLLVALPNAGSLEARLFGGAWYHLDLPRHLWGFTPRTLTRLLETGGFVVSEFRFLPFLFAPQSARTALRRKQPVAAGAAERAPASGGGRLRTRVFLAMLNVSERLGRIIPGEIMEVMAVRPADKSDNSDEATTR